MSSWWVLYLCFQDSGQMRRHKWSVEHKEKTPHSLWFCTGLTFDSHLWEISLKPHDENCHIKCISATCCFSHSLMRALLPRSPCPVWLRGTRLLDCLSPNPDRPKAQIPACYSNRMQPVEGNQWHSAESPEISLKYIYSNWAWLGLRRAVSTISWWG